ncbi:MAG: AAC(3) family N-acetyltransferase [Vicinamibacterales bacterium]
MSVRTIRLRRLLDELEVQAGDLVYLHTSFSRLRHLGLSPTAFLDVLIEHLGPAGTLVSPSFAWHLDPLARPWSGYARYYVERPVFDVRTTPANIGLIPELFRQRPGVRRSTHFWWSVAALGPLAEIIIQEQEDVTHPYGHNSAFSRMHRHGVKILGLGVTLNTTSLAPIVDHELGDRHTQRILSADLEEGVVVDTEGRRIVTRAYWLLPEVVRLIAPSEVFDRAQGLDGRLRRVDEGATIQFAYPFQAYFVSAMRLGTDAAVQGERMPWLRRFPLRADGPR